MKEVFEEHTRARFPWNNLFWKENVAWVPPDCTQFRCAKCIMEYSPNWKLHYSWKISESIEFSQMLSFHYEFKFPENQKHQNLGDFIVRNSFWTFSVNTEHIQWIIFPHPSIDSKHMHNHLFAFRKHMRCRDSLRYAVYALDWRMAYWNFYHSFTVIRDALEIQLRTSNDLINLMYSPIAIR